ncbi:DUF3049 family protein [Medicago truncatula]|uniref:DUF3049 family protein n=1 Tax=Medicago truncatula TaxID=3880 RepID=G7IRE7_MEDTR|nr:DUF3049 family protein [Medicago truncatula]
MVMLFGSESDRNGSQNGLSSSPMKKYDSTIVTGELDIWSSILTQKKKDEASQSKTPPYIHPLVKNSQNYLSEKSLEMCTEILGSENGSDGFFSSYTSFEDNNSKDGEKLKEKVNMVKKPRCFPPPLPLLFSQSQPLKMRPHRDNGRLFLFLEVVSVPSHNNFLAKRQNGRLILTFANEEEKIVDDFEQHGSLPRSLPLINVVPLIPNDQQNSISNKVIVYRNMNIYQGSNEASKDLQHLFVLSEKNKDYLVHNFGLCKASRATRDGFTTQLTWAHAWVQSRIL